MPEIIIVVYNIFYNQLNIDNITNSNLALVVYVNAAINIFSIRVVDHYAWCRVSEKQFIYLYTEF